MGCNCPVSKHNAITKECNISKKLIKVNNKINIQKQINYKKGIQYATGLLNNTLNSNIFPEAHLLDYSVFPLKKYSFAGPFTDLKKRLNPDDSWKDWSAPRNPLDKGAYYHDLCYRDNKDVATRNKCDADLKKISDKQIKDGKTLSERNNARLVSSVMFGKVILGAGGKKKARKGRNKF